MTAATVESPNPRPPPSPPEYCGALENPVLTAAFWGTAAIFALAYWLTPFPPCIDYPQHLALGALIGRLLNPGAVEHATYVIDPFTYNGLFQVLVGILSWIMPTEIAGKLLLSAIPLLLASSTLALVRVARRPSWYAFFALPFSYSYIVGWGFINYSLGVPIGLLLLAWWMRWRDGERRLLPWLVGGALLLAYTHVLAMLCFCIHIGVATLVSRWPREVGFAAWLRSLVTGPLPVAPGVLYSLLVFLHHRAAPHIYWEPQKDGTDTAAWNKLYYLSSFAVNNLGNHLDRVLFVAALVLLGMLFVVAACTLPDAPKAAGAPGAGGSAPPGHQQTSAPRRHDREFAWLAGVWFLLYLVTPRVFMSTWWIFERLPLLWVVMLVTVTPVRSGEVTRWIRGAIAGLGLVLALVTAYAFASIPDARDADAIIDDIPEGSRVVALIYSTSASPAIWREMWVHQLAYYVVRRRGEIAFDFTRYASLPVRRRDAGEHPPLFPSGREWTPQYFDPYAAYARAFPRVLVRTPDDSPDEDPRARVFGDDLGRVHVMSRHGRFWLLDATSWQAEHNPGQ